MSKKLLITRPHSDIVTSYLSYWNQQIISSAQKNGFIVSDLHRDKATKKLVESHLIKQDFSLVLFNGHGNGSTITGHNKEELISVGMNESLLKDSIVYALSCESAKFLGPAAVKKGTISFIGYTFPFMFVTDKTRTCTPDHDVLADIFKEPAILISENLINGCSVEDALEKTKSKYKSLIRKFSSSQPTPELRDTNETIRRLLFFNMLGLVAVGDKTAIVA